MRQNKIIEEDIEEDIEESRKDFEQKEQDIKNDLASESPDIVMQRIEEALAATYILTEGMSNSGRNSELGAILLHGIVILRETLSNTLNWFQENCIVIYDNQDITNEEVSIDKKIQL